MDKRFPLALVIVLTPFVFLLSCKKVNEATLLGGSLVPEADNITTFEKTFAAQTNNVGLSDTTNLVYSDAVALGTISNDPEFGQTNASVYFQINPATYGIYPFTAVNPTIDSVVLSLDYIGGYGDTNAQQTVHVYEISQNSTFNDTTYYKFSQPDFETTGPELGSATFVMSTLDDSISLIRKQDTTKVGNQLRIRLSNDFGQRIASADTTAYRNDTLFKKFFRGFALKTTNGNGLAYFSLATSNTSLTIYYRAPKTGGTIDTSATVFSHSLRILSTGATTKGGQANSIVRQPGGGWATYLENNDSLDDKLYIQSTPGGSAGYIKIPALDTLQNKVIHRAELVATRLPSAFDNFFWAPGHLFVDRINEKGDSAFAFPEFVSSSISSSGATIYSFSNFTAFGGALRADETYRFDITKLVQDVITGKQPKPITLRLYAPFISEPYYPGTSPIQHVSVQAVPFPAYGRVVLAGGNYADSSQQLHLRVIYSNL